MINSTINLNELFVSGCKLEFEKVMHFPPLLVCVCVCVCVCMCVC